MSDSESTSEMMDSESTDSPDAVSLVDSDDHVCSRDDSENSKKLFAPLGESITHKAPFVAGSLQLPSSHFYLLYKTSNDDHLRHVNLANAAPEELEHLAQICEPPGSDHSKEEATDESRRKRRKIESNTFSPTVVPHDWHTDLIKIVRDYLLEGTDSTRQIDIKLSELSVYNKGSLFKSYFDIPPREIKFGSLVVAFPTSHEGGALVLRQDSQEWTFDLSTALLAAPSASLAYAAFLGNVEHEVLPVTSGHRVMLTYNLYFGEDEDASTKDLVSEPPSFPREPNESTFSSRFADLLKVPHFLPHGGMLAFGLRNVYQVKDKLEHIYGQLKGIDATVYQSLRGLGLEPTLYLYYERDGDDERYHGSLLTKPPGLECFDFYYDDNHENYLLDEFMRDEGISITTSKELTWVTPRTDFNIRETPYIEYDHDKDRGNQRMMRGELCLAVRIGEAGKRLVYSKRRRARRW